MDKTPNRKPIKLSCTKKQEPPEDDTIVISQLSASSCPTSTPIKPAVSDLDDDDFGSRCTQELEVVWDWNSPKNNRQPERRKFRNLSNRQSPKVTFKRHPSNNNRQQNFEKLREELQALREQLAIPDNEACLQLSPREEAEFKFSPREEPEIPEPEFKEENGNHSAIHSLIENDNYNGDKDIEDIFNDSLDEQLFQCTQKLEKELVGGAPKEVRNGHGPQATNYQNTSNKRSNSDVPNKQNKTEFSAAKRIMYNNTVKAAIKTSVKLDDSLDVVLEGIQDEEIERLSQQSSQKNKEVNDKIGLQRHTFQRTRSDIAVQLSKQNTLQTESGKVEFFRTHSFELSRIIEKEGNLPPDKLKEIERKRQEALSKLELKKRKEGSPGSVECSPDEIEQKRLQAIARLEAKKKQELDIERKRKEALKRLELNKMKRAVGFKNIVKKL